MSTPFILCENLVKVYKPANLEVIALQGLDLVIQAGEIIGIIGSSGSGKSTLLSVLGGLDKPSAGRCLVNGKDLLKMSENDRTLYRRESVGFVWQQGARNLVHYLSAAQNVELPMMLAGKMNIKAMHKRTDDLLEAVGLADRKHHKMSGLSGGEQQRVAIAVALANAAPLLLADEPTGELDTRTALTVYQALHDIRTRYGVTILIVSHDRNIAHYVDRVMGIQDGKVATETTAALQGEARLMLDSAGRLQIPKAMRERYGIGSRVALEETAEGLVIKPL
jgi:ABC-type lipoprotein export system ATPase subunit